ncbi:MAG: hypothetical protein RMJ98_00480 [Myxococcales bacterium]|nr:hypothetical protein [Polyangiaceae bacterium]MDW8247762.1 hypothetical protein [Myxococcales bacterium]
MSHVSCRLDPDALTYSKPLQAAILVDLGALFHVTCKLGPRRRPAQKKVTG